MGTFEIIGGVLLLLFCGVIMVTVTLMESPKGGGLGALGAGDQTSFFDRNRGKTKESMLTRATSICGAGLAVVVLAMLLILK